VSEDAPANPIARFEHDAFSAGAAEIKRSGQTSGPRANYQDIRRFCL